MTEFIQGKFYKDTLHNIKVMFCAEMVSICNMETAYKFWDCYKNIEISYTKDTIKYVSEEWTEPRTYYFVMNENPQTGKVYAEISEVKPIKRDDTVAIVKFTEGQFDE